MPFLQRFLLKNFIISTRNSHFTKVGFKNGIKTITMCDTKTRYSCGFLIMFFLNTSFSHFNNRNSLSLGMMSDLLSNLKDNADDKNLRVVVLSAEGPIFSAGHNLKEMVIFFNEL